MWASAYAYMQDYVNRQTRFVSRQPAKVIISAIEAAAGSMGLKIHTRSYKVAFPSNSVIECYIEIFVVLGFRKRDY